MNSINDILHTHVEDILPNDVDIEIPVDVKPIQEPGDNVTELVQEYVLEIESLLSKIKSALGTGTVTRSAPPAVNIPKTHTPLHANTSESANAHEGVFNGEHMIGPDGATYPVPPNYASKSKLVEGDLLKVTVTPNGMLIFKQIGPTERERRMGELLLEEDGTYRVVCNNNPYRVLTAAITYHKGRPGQQVVLLTPKGVPSKWAAVEYIVEQK